MSTARDDRTRELRHDLGNALGALRLRVQIVNADPTCRAAQGKNLDAIERIVKRSMELFAQLATQPAGPRAPRSRKRRKRRAKTE